MSYLKEKQDQSVGQSQFDTNILPSSLRLNTDEVLGSYRENYQKYELLQELSQSKTIIEMKNKEIFYLTTQMVSIKDECTQKIIHLETSLSEQKKQLTQLRYLNIKNKRKQSDQNAKLVDEVKKICDGQLIQQKDSYEKIIQKLKGQHAKQIEALEQKMFSMLNLQKQQKKFLQGLSSEQGKNFQALNQQLKSYSQKLEREKQKLEKQVQKYGQSLDSIKQQFKQYENRMEENTNKLHLENEHLKSTIATNQRSIMMMKKQVQEIKEKSEKEIKESLEESEMQREQNMKIKKLLKHKDKEIEQIVDNLNQAYSSRYGKNPAKLDPVRQCQHEGLLKQFQRNMDLKNKENQQLRRQLMEWGNYIGFQKNIEERSEELLNVSSEALSVQQKFSTSLKKKYNKVK